MLKKSLIMVALIFSFQLVAEQVAENVSVLRETKEVISVFKQCSRMSPSFITSYSHLDTELVTKIELMLPAALKKLAKDKSINLDDYYRQYVSFGQLKRAGVYLNAIHKDAAKKWAKNNPERIELLKNWQTKSINICGGKDLHWGAIYDDFGGAISEILFNDVRKN